MHIGLLSDTHIPGDASELPRSLKHVFDGVDLILHAGDIYTSSVLDELSAIAPVLAARGDDDSGEVLRDERVKWKHVLKLENHTIWLIHEMPYPYPVASWRAGTLKVGSDNNVPDIVVFGHDHCTIIERHDRVLMINPGSPTFLNYRCGPGTVALLDIMSSEAQVRIVEL